MMQISNNKKAILVQVREPKEKSNLNTKNSGTLYTTELDKGASNNENFGKKLKKYLKIAFK